jgi:SAM-dependent methyltransferase
VKLSHKIDKLRRSEFYKRSWRRLQRKLHPLDPQRFLAKLDPKRVHQIQARYASSPVQIAKYANIERWIRLNIERVQDLQLHRSPPKDILDLGCGGGFFLFICQQLGHRSLGLDLEWFPLFTELLDLFQIERRTWEIKPFEPLPDLGRKFDWITAFSTGFNRIKKKPWGPREWEFFLTDLETRLQPRGKIFFALNPEGKTGRYYSNKLRDFFLSRGAEIERERIFFSRVKGHLPS